jgi:glutamate/tyrosine decarboxylase-like PLP-dependent enzyme
MGAPAFLRAISLGEMHFSNMFTDTALIAKLSAEIAEIHTEPPPENALPADDLITHARERLFQHLPEAGIGLEGVIEHLRKDIVSGFNGSSRSRRYYGFVTGGSTPAASLADNLVTAYDQNVQVHLTNETVATDLEDKALDMLCELLRLDPSHWRHRLFTTGATASNILGLACGREYVITEAAAVRGDAPISVGEIGIYEAMHRSGIDKIQILTTEPHSSLRKAASILGLGHASIRCIGLEDAPHRFDMAQLKQFLTVPGTASIVAISAAEVNSGLFATAGLEEIQKIRAMCDAYGAWIHVDGGQ